jgi:polar amino acid transport system substrate-binding protein
VLKYVRGRFLIVFDISLWIVNMSRYVLPRNVFEVFDAIGLAAFTVTGVVIASRYGADPIWIWGPLLGALTAAGGGILRDVFRADAHNPALKTSFYAEIAICWGMLLSIFIYFRAMEVNAQTMRTAVVVIVVGAFVTRMGIVVAKLSSPRF